tara:strand:- start:1615 stop:2172 length:558 start_codon:yes stop_codon:yes gene_type:complete
MSEQNNNLRSIEELDARYARFCLNNKLDSELTPAQQVEEMVVIENSRLSMWLERHIAERRLAEEGDSLVATGESASLVENIHLDCEAISKGGQRVAASMSVKRKRASTEDLEIIMAALTEAATEIEDERETDPVEVRKSPVRKAVKKAVRAVAGVAEAATIKAANPAVRQVVPVSQKPEQMGLFA